MNKTVTITSKNHKYATTYGGNICQSDFCTDYEGTRNIADRIFSDWRLMNSARKILKVEIGKMFSRQDYKYFKKAKSVANISNFPKVHIGCIAVYQGNIIGIGCNSNKTHPIQDYYNRYRLHNQSSVFSAKLHAEISCLLSIKNMNLNFSKVKLYIFRNMKDKSFGMCRPCPSCMAMIKDLGIRHIYYTSDTGFIYEKVGE